MCIPHVFICVCFLFRCKLECVCVHVCVCVHIHVGGAFGVGVAVRFLRCDVCRSHGRTSVNGVAKDGVAGVHALVWTGPGSINARCEE